MEDQLLTPPFRVNQTDTHVIIEAQCPLTPSSVNPDAVVEETIFALRCPPYYLPLHFPAALTAVETIHRTNSIIRIDLRKEEQGLDFIGLQDIQPTMFVDADPQQQAGPSSQTHRKSKKVKDEEAESILEQVLEREGMTSVKEDKVTPKEQPTQEIASHLFSNLSEADIEYNKAAAETDENQRFDEQSYLDSYVDEEHEVEDLLKWQYTTASTSSSSPSIPVAEGDQATVDSKIRLLLLDLLYAYHLGLLASTGPPIYPWLLCSLSRSFSQPPSPPYTSSDNVTSTLRSSFRRGLVFPLHRNWRLCGRAAQDVITRLLAGKGEVLSGLQDISECLLDGEREATEGPEEAARWSMLNVSVVTPLICKVKDAEEKIFTSLAEEIRDTLPSLTKESVGPSWDLELLEHMADEVIAEEREEQESRLLQDEKDILHSCASLTPPLALQEGNDAFAGERDGGLESKLTTWRTIEAPASLSRLVKILQKYNLRLRHSRGQSGDDAVRMQAAVIVAASRFAEKAPWTSSETQILASRILTTYLRRPTLRGIRFVLENHLRSLFLSPSLGSINEDGRLRHERPHLSKAAKASAYEEGEKWKGKQGRDLQGLDMIRSEGAGSHLTFKICLETIAELSRSRRGQEDAEPWEVLWPLVVPPLITLIEDSDPLWRERGTRLLVDQVLTSRRLSNRKSTPLPQQIVPLQLLHRSNLVPLLQTTLFNSLTYLSHPQGVDLLHYALSALIHLARSLPLQSRERAEALMKIVQEGILRTWTFMPKSIDSISQLEEGTQKRDLLETTFGHLSILLIELGFLSARFLAVVMDFLLAQIAALYEGLVSSNGTLAGESTSAWPAVDTERRRMISRKVCRVIEAVKTSRILIEQSCEMDTSPTPPSEGGLVPLDPFPPNLPRWISRCLAAYVKAWLAVQDITLAKEVKAEGEKLRVELQLGVRIWTKVLPDRVAEIRHQILQVEPSLYDLFDVTIE